MHPYHPGLRVTKAILEQNGRIRNFEFIFRRKSGETGTGLLSSEFVELRGERILLGIIMDITERKQAEDEIRRLNVEMEKRVADRSRELSTFLDLAFLVSHRESLDHVFGPVLERILEISMLKVVCIYILSSDRQYLTLEAEVGLEAHEQGDMCMVLPNRYFAHWLNQPREALLLSNLEEDRSLPEPMRPARLKSCLVAQLVSQGEVLGLMSCYYEESHTFSLEEISLLVALAEQLGVSLENHRLRQEAESLAITTERQRLARDLHDTITQSIYGLTLFTRSSKDALIENDETRLASNLDLIETNAVLALKNMRLLLYQMQPQELEGGLENAINKRLDLVERRLGIHATSTIDKNLSLSTELEEALFRIALEAFNNSLKHASAKHVDFTLVRRDHDFVMEITDDGQGFDVDSKIGSGASNGMGLGNMRSRAAEINGVFEIKSSVGKGTHIRVVLPKFDKAPTRRR